LAARADAIITAGLRPELFAERGILSASRTLVFVTLTLLVLAGFGFRVQGLSAEGLSEDELNKLLAVADYREHGLTSANGEHPLLMKALQLGSIYLVEKWNNTALASQLQVAPETALRLPGTIFGALTAILIYLLSTELFGAEVGLSAAALWTFDPSAIGFNRIAKEDTFLLFFFLLANVFWLRGQRVAESEPRRRPQPYYWATAAAFGATMASKYLPQLLAVSLSYYWMFQAIPETRWRLGKKRMLLVVAIMCGVFLVLNPTILLPDTWHRIGLFAVEKRMAHDGYEFMGTLYSHRMTAWLKGLPWYFYYVFVGVKLPPLTIAGLLVGLPLLFRRKLGDGRYFILFWMFFWLITFTITGGKFTRYLTVVLPAVLITTAIGVQFAGRWIAERLASLSSSEGVKTYLSAALALLVVITSVVASANSAPHYRLYTNALGGGMGRAGYYFPHDEFYDASMRELISEISKRARPGAHVASESPTLAAYYALRAKRPDLVCLQLSDPQEFQQLAEGDFVIAARGRRYFSNDALVTALHQASTPAFRLALGEIPSADVYELDKSSLNIVRDTLRGLAPLASILSTKFSPNRINHGEIRR
jgi:hypothetical protein